MCSDNRCLRQGLALRYASAELRADREVRHSGHYFLHLFLRLGIHWAIAWLTRWIRCDKVVLAAVARAGAALRYAADAFRGDRGVVLCAVRQDGWALQWASPALRADVEVGVEAVIENYRAIGHVPVQLRDAVLTAARARAWRPRPLGPAGGEHAIRSGGGGDDEGGGGSGGGRLHGWLSSPRKKPASRKKPQTPAARFASWATSAPGHAGARGGVDLLEKVSASTVSELSDDSSDAESSSGW